MKQKAIFVGLFVVGVAIVYWWSTMSSGSCGYEGFESKGADYEFVMYGVDWCPHCVSAKPEFEALGSTKTIGGATVKCVVVNPEKEPAKVRGKVEGYPTIHLYDAQGTLVEEYSGPRTKAGFEAFLNQKVKA